MGKVFNYKQTEDFNFEQQEAQYQEEQETKKQQEIDKRIMKCIEDHKVPEIYRERLCIQIKQKGQGLQILKNHKAGGVTPTKDE